MREPINFEESTDFHGMGWCTIQHISAPDEATKTPPPGGELALPRDDSGAAGEDGHADRLPREVDPRRRAGVPLLVAY